MNSVICLCPLRLNCKVKNSTALLRHLKSVLCGVFKIIDMSIYFSPLGAGEKVIKDIRPGVPFEPTYIYRLLTLIKSSLSEKVSRAIRLSSRV